MKSKFHPLFELTVVITVIILLAGSFYPVILKQISKANEAADLANARLLYTATCLAALDTDSITAGSFTVDEDGSIPKLFSAYIGPDWPQPKAAGATAFQVVIKVTDSIVAYEVQRIFDGSIEVFNPDGYIFQ